MKVISTNEIRGLFGCRQKLLRALKRVTRVQYAREYSLLPYLETLVTDIHFQQMAAAHHHADVLRQEFCISRLKVHL